MRTKKRWYFVWMLVFVMLVFAGCGEKPKKDTDTATMDVQKDFVEKALKEIVKKMKPDGPVSNDKKIQRSLAIHILKDHTALMAYFQSQQWTEMEGVMGNAKVYINAANGVRIDGVPNKGFWQELYDKKKEECGEEISIELEIYANDIPLKDIKPIEKDIKPIEDEDDCESTEFFKFRIICIDKDGNEISNQGGGGSIDRRHSGLCPWI